MMRRFCLLTSLVGIGVCAAAPMAVAFDGESLASRTTISMYDDVDPFDLALDPALIYENERWRLYTSAAIPETT